MPAWLHIISHTIPYNPSSLIPLHSSLLPHPSSLLPSPLLMIDLVTAYGVGGATGLSTEAVMNYAKNTGAFAHSNAEVRDSAKELTVGTLSYKSTITHPLPPILYHPSSTTQLTAERSVL